MKRLLPLLILGLLIYSCKPEPEHCWKCDITYSSNMADSTGDTLLCNFTRTDIELREGIKFDATGTGYKTWLLSNCQQR